MTQPREPIPIRATEAPYLLLPDSASLFLDRALRLQSLAPGEVLEDYLRFMAELSHAQHRALATFPALSQPEVEAGQPPLAIGAFMLDPAWQQVFFAILDEVSTKAPPDFATHLKLLKTASGTDLDGWAQAYLVGDAADCDLGVLTMVVASLQVYWTALTRNLHGVSIKSSQAGQATCPVCNSPPVGSLVSSGTAGLRYLCCSLCSSQWNLERIHCVNCGESQSVFYYDIEGSDGSVQAECCDACHSYSKILHLEKNPSFDMVADDVATMALDVLVGEAGYQRYGMNPFLLTGPESVPGHREFGMDE